MQTIPTVIITGLSGSGKSTAMRALEDAGFSCIDNLPPIVLPKFLELCSASSADISKIAMVMDVRERAFLKEYPAIFRELKAKGQELTILFLDSTDEILVRRYKKPGGSTPWQKKEPFSKAYRRNGSDPGYAPSTIKSPGPQLAP